MTRAYSALGSLGGEQAIAWLEKALADPGEGVRRHAVIAFGNIGGARALALLEKALDDASDRVRSEAVHVLEKVGGEKVLPRLEKALGDPAWDVRCCAVKGLKGVGGEKALALVEKAFADKDAGVCSFQLGRGKAALGFLGGGLAVLALAQALAAADTAPGDETFELQETSAFNKEFSLSHLEFARGQSADCQERPDRAVKGYPDFASKKPIYGSIRFDRRLREPESGILYYFALDESQGTGKGYDRLYFDSNRDLDLRNDPVLKPWPDHPKGADYFPGRDTEQVVFERFSIRFDWGPAGKRAVQFVLRLVRHGSGGRAYSHVSLMRAQICEGEIKLGNRRFLAMLGNNSQITSRLDSPEAALHLAPVGGSGNVGGSEWWGGDWLSSIQKVDGKFFTFSASPAGDRLTVHPYRGELGTFEIGPGGRTLNRMTIEGCLQSANSFVALGGEMLGGQLREARSCQVPVGDYVLALVSVQFGRLDKEETFDVQVLYDTLELYGKVKGSRAVTVCRE